jgi:hypothetical protein
MFRYVDKLCGVKSKRQTSSCDNYKAQHHSHNSFIHRGSGIDSLKGSNIALIDLMFVDKIAHSGSQYFGTF